MIECGLGIEDGFVGGGFGFLPARNVFYAIVLPLLLLVILPLNVYFGVATKFSGAVAALFSFLLIFYVLNNDIIIKPLVRIGEFSYSLYITHVASILLFMSLSNYLFQIEVPVLNRWMWLLAIPFCLVVAYIAWWLVERNDSKWKNAFQ